MNFLFTSFFYVHKLSAWLFLGAAMRFFGFRLFLVFGFYFEFVQGRVPLKGFVYGRHTRKIPLSQGFSSCITVHRSVIGNRQSRLSHSPFSELPSVWGFRRLRTATIGASRPPRPPRQSSRALQPHFFDKRRSFVRERNKQGSCRRQLLGNSAKPTFHTSLHPALFNF